MARLYMLRCDHCRSLAESKDTGHWYHVERCNPREWEDVGDSDQFHFCSLPCVAAWASSRELVRLAS